VAAIWRSTLNTEMLETRDAIAAITTALNINSRETI